MPATLHMKEEELKFFLVEDGMLASINPIEALNQQNEAIYEEKKCVKVNFVRGSSKVCPVTFVTTPFPQHIEVVKNSWCEDMLDLPNSHPSHLLIEEKSLIWIQKKQRGSLTIYPNLLYLKGRSRRILYYWCKFHTCYFAHEVSRRNWNSFFFKMGC